MSPSRDLRMIPRPQHFGDRAPFPLNRPGIVRIFEKPLVEALFLSAGGRAHYPGKQPHASIEDDHRAKLSAGEHIIADRHRFERPRVEDSLVEPLEPAGEQDHALARRELAHPCLRQRSAARRQRQHRPAVGNAVDRGREHVRPKHHPCPAARRRVVDAAMLVGREVADVASRRGSRSPPRAPALQGSRRAAPETCPGRGSGRMARKVIAAQPPLSQSIGRAWTNQSSTA